MVHTVVIICAPEDNGSAMTLAGFAEMRRIPCFFPARDASPGKKRNDDIMNAIQTCRYVVAYVSNDSIRSDEFRHAFDYAKTLKKPIFTYDARTEIPETEDGLDGTVWHIASDEDGEEPAHVQLFNAILKHAKERTISGTSNVQKENNHSISITTLIAGFIAAVLIIIAFWKKVPDSIPLKDNSPLIMENSIVWYTAPFGEKDVTVYQTNSSELLFSWKDTGWIENIHLVILDSQGIIYDSQTTEGTDIIYQSSLFSPGVIYNLHMDCGSDNYDTFFSVPFHVQYKTQSE